jgi:hypothetical protein
MTRELNPIPFDEFAGDVAGTIDRVVRDNAPIVVEHNGNRVIVTPMRPGPRRRRGPNEADLAAFQESAGSMRDLIDAEALKSRVAAGRGSRPTRVSPRVAQQHLAALDAIYRSVPALDPPRTWEEIETIAQEEAARDAMREA